MSNPGEIDSTPIASVRQLADWFAAGCKPPEAFGIGTEHEKFGFRFDTLAPPAYAPGGIRALLEGMAERIGGTAIRDGENLIGLAQPDGAALSLEPAGQFELSGAPVPDLHATRAELERHLKVAREVAAGLGFGFAGLGFHPTARREDMPWMPKGRYAIMRRYMPTRGGLGLDMMTRTCTVQVNLDYTSEADMVRKLHVALALQPVATALFANSPFTEGRPNGYLSWRGHVWTDTDPDRTGIPAVFFEEGFGFERYAQWLVDAVPMYFVHRENGYIDLAGRSFRDFLEGKIPAPSGPAIGPATLGDFADHLTTVFTDVRIKRFLEMRGADAGSVEMMVAQSAFWVGLLYDPAALAAAEALVRRAPWQDYAALREAAARQALDAPWKGGTLRDLARDAVAIARDGLAARARRNASGQDERIHLAPLEALAAGAPTQAERWLERWRGPWHGNASRIFVEAEY